MKYYTAIIVVALFVSAIVAPLAATADQSRPNVVFLAVDDMNDPTRQMEVDRSLQNKGRVFFNLAGEIVETVNLANERRDKAKEPLQSLRR